MQLYTHAITQLQDLVTIGYSLGVKDVSFPLSSVILAGWFGREKFWQDGLAWARRILAGWLGRGNLGGMEVQNRKKIIAFLLLPLSSFYILQRNDRRSLNIVVNELYTFEIKVNETDITFVRDCRRAVNYRACSNIFFFSLSP